MNEATISAALTFFKGGANFVTQPQSAQFTVAGLLAIKNVKLIGTSDETLDLGALGTIGYVFFRNLELAVAMLTPDAPSVGNQGAAGAATWTYKIVGRDSNGSYTEASPAGTTATGNATLSGTNFNRLTWEALDGAASYDIYRTVHGTSPTTLGLIGNTTALTFDDTGLAGDASTAPTINSDKIIELGSESFIFVVTVPDPILISVQGAAGAATWTYKIVARQSNGMYAAASNPGSTASGNATLNGSNFNRISWPAVPGADFYDVYRTVHGTSPATTGLIGTVTDPTIDDTGLAGDSSTPPSSGIPSTPPVLSRYPAQLKGGDSGVIRWNGAAIHAKANANGPALLETTIIEA